jgi:hypothetical protein
MVMQNQYESKETKSNVIENVVRPRAWIVGVNMGYGHQRTAYPLKNLAPDQRVINANDYEGIPEKDRNIWETSRKFYEFMSNFKRLPVVGELAFKIFDRFQKILSFYPRRDLSRSNITLKQLYSLIKKGWGEDLIKRLSQKPLPLISTFFTPAFMAENFNYSGDIYCIVCDADIARTWAPPYPKQSKIKYFAPTPRAADRLELYGVKKSSIFLTGYPLPKENLGSSQLEIAKEDLGYRISNLDPKGRYRQQYDALIKKYIGQLPEKSNHPLTVMFSIGGAGAQVDIAAKIVKSLINKIWDEKIKLILVTGLRENVKDYFLEYIKRLGLDGSLNRYVEIIWASDIDGYFEKFNQALRVTDILWTKPSELSFYTALGLPIIIAPTIGSQEEFNRDWLLQVGSAMLQQNPAYADQWLFDLLDSGWFAEAAMQGFIEVEKMGTYNIEKIIGQNS